MTTPMLIVTSLMWPLLLAAMLVSRRLARPVQAMAWTGAVPALFTALTGEQGARVDASWMLTGVSYGLDAIGVTFLLFTSLLWVLAGLYATVLLRDDPRARRFQAFFLLSLFGNIGLILAQDMVSFYLCFALMSFAAYVLVIHDGSAEARYAGRIYIILVVIGEALLVSGVLFAATQAGTSFDGLAARLAHSPQLPLIVALLLVGFGIKAGVVPLHVWLPLAHPVAPTPASAVLSGAMIKAGLLGWLRFLPLGEVTLTGAGELCLLVGMVSAFYGVAVGLTQRNPKTVLAYSSVSQIGLMTVGVGIGFAVPDVWPVVAGAVMIYALHHGLAKGALFLSVGIVNKGPQRALYRYGVMAGLLLPALALAGAPLTSGMPAKALLKEALYLSDEPWAALLVLLLPVAATGTMLLMARFLFIAWPRQRGDAPVPLGLVLPWGMLLACVAFLAWVEFFTVPLERITPAIPWTDVWTYLWPVALGGGLAYAAGKVGWMRGREIPAGDVLVYFERIAAASRAAWRAYVAAPIAEPPAPPPLIHPLAGRVAGWEGWTGRWSMATAAFVLLVIVLALALSFW
jgi:formate hydrogenlyase subunit 3/multisubunit Na+/H+ antiporter MnhD subunit